MVEEEEEAVEEESEAAPEAPARLGEVVEEEKEEFLLQMAEMDPNHKARFLEIKMTLDSR